MPQTVPTLTSFTTHNDCTTTIANNATDAETRLAAAELHAASTSNPHSVTKSQVGLGNVDNTSDVNKPISLATQTALDAKLNVSGLTTITITDAAVAMVANRRYVGSIAAFTADRNYTVPAGAAGDVIEIQLTTGDDAFELIIIGATGVSINGGSTATEWSRLFIDNEFVRLRCHATNDWRVEVDGRIPQRGRLRQETSQNISHDTATKLTFGTAVTNIGSICDLANSRFLPRRTGLYTITVRGSFTALSPATRVINYAWVNGAAADLSTSFVSFDASHYPQFVTEQSVSAGQAVEGYVQWERTGGSGTEDTFVANNLVKPYIAIRELF